MAEQLERMDDLKTHPLSGVLGRDSLDRDKKASYQVYTILRQAIVSLELLPNEPISEQDVASVLAISRTPVREAFIRLSEEGLLVSYPQLATVVAPIRMELMLEAQFLREKIESALAERAATMVDEEGAARLREALSRHDEMLSAERWSEFYAMDEETHRLIGEIAGLPGLSRTMQQARAHLDRMRHVLLPEKETSRRVIEQHSAVIEMICAHRPTEAYNAMVTHTRDILIRLPELRAMRPDLFEERPVTRTPWRAR